MASKKKLPKSRVTVAAAPVAAQTPTAPPPLGFFDCPECDCPVPEARNHCPHCARPQFFPNVQKARTTAETQKLNKAHQNAGSNATARKCVTEAQGFENACRKTQAVFACPISKLHRQIASGTEIFENFNDTERLKLRGAATGKRDWATLRVQAEEEILGSHKYAGTLHYASLSIDGRALNYGDLVATLKEEMIAHRASCIEGNTAELFAKTRNFSSLLRCDWDNRHKICLAVFEKDLTPGTQAAQFPSLIVVNGATTADDRFIEVHIFGAMTARTLQSVHIRPKAHNERERVYLDAIREELAKVGVSLA